MAQNPLIERAAADRHRDDAACCARQVCTWCGWHVSTYNCNGALIAARPSGVKWDWWVACDNAACDHHWGEGIHEMPPDWVVRLEDDDGPIKPESAMAMHRTPARIAMDRLRAMQAMTEVAGEMLGVLRRMVNGPPFAPDEEMTAVLGSFEARFAASRREWETMISRETYDVAPAVAAQAERRPDAVTVAAALAIDLEKVAQAEGMPLRPGAGERLAAAALAALALAGVSTSAIEGLAAGDLHTCDGYCHEFCGDDRV